MLVNREAVSAIFISLKTIFNQAFGAAPSDWQDTAMKVPSTGRTNSYAWLSKFPKLREWIGDKVVQRLKASSYTITNEPFEATVAVDRDDIADDQIGIYGNMAQMAGFSAQQWPDELIADLKNGAFANQCYDGQYFYDTDHPVGDGVASNKGTAALSNATESAADASFGAARTAMMSLKDEEGRPLNIIPDTLEVPVALETTAKALMENGKLADGTPNPYKGLAKVKVNARLTSTTAWFLHCTSMPIKPFIFQEREAAHFVSQTDLTSDDVFSRKEFKFGAEARGAAGYGLWQLSYASTGA